MSVRFPHVSGTNLERKHLSLPQDLEGQVNVLFVSFFQWHQREIDSWVPTVRQLETVHQDVCYYVLPVIGKESLPAQGFINSGMRAGSSDSLARERTITLYLDKTAFRQTLDMPDQDHIYVLLADRDGQILWRERGTCTPGKSAALGKHLERLLVRD